MATAILGILGTLVPVVKDVLPSIIDRLMRKQEVQLPQTGSGPVRKKNVVESLGELLQGFVKQGVLTDEELNSLISAADLIIEEKVAQVDPKKAVASVVTISPAEMTASIQNGMVTFSFPDRSGSS